ncbi:RcnB family protein [Cobetia crustatorum]|uniref:RcnB family protein n=2 Tax=Halomonadaceae TaxID=28256 RepID=A0A558HQI5_9GAMM|nr:RcnB family protein [Cobetia crustatorum]
MTLVLVSTLLGSSLTLAAPNDERYQQKSHQKDQKKSQQKHQQEKGHQAQKGHVQQKRQANNGHQNKAKAHPSHHWKRGDKVPSGYYNDKRYWVSDWEARHLSRPPQGHRWLQVDGRYVLAAVAGGVITAIILNQ